LFGGVHKFYDVGFDVRACLMRIMMVMHRAIVVQIPCRRRIVLFRKYCRL